ncbi:hypothetical protein PV08_08269 [Exophiala spinifera]|uniref:Uncharacterized protein n=1 Tax=Exophiala spinifera TaxID=91928 RepID=A0A0D1ZJU6_9EURO|nr:uncharacterized protein PV08_08269 [Exophiala spinifera]KIW13082.1 hypothetical protein PV08_08269 [Exophiala spinifera]
MPVEKEQQNLQLIFDARRKYKASPSTAESIFSVFKHDEDPYKCDVMVKLDGETKYLGRALLDTGSMYSMMSEKTAVRVEAWGLTTIDRSEATRTEGIKTAEGILEEAKIKVVGKLSLKFSGDGVHYYRHTFIVIPHEDRFEILLGAKVLHRWVTADRCANSSSQSPLAKYRLLAPLGRTWDRRSCRQMLRSTLDFIQQ